MPSFLLLPRCLPCAHRVPARRGFTLVELLVVMAVILMLAGMVVGIGGYVARMRSSARAQGDLNMIAQGLESFKAAQGDYPWATGAISAIANPAAIPGPITNNNRNLFAALAGRGIFTFSAGNPSFSHNGRSFSDPKLVSHMEVSRLRIALASAPTLPLSSNTTLTDSDYLILDPWSRPYVYAYKWNNTGTWKSASFILLTAGEDGKLALDGHMDTSTGRFDYDVDGKPSHLGLEDNLDNLVFGFQ